ncbi:MAG: cytochrome c-type biogenesis protein CcmH [Myxococcota bacterium]
MTRGLVFIAVAAVVSMAACGSPDSASRTDDSRTVQSIVRTTNSPFCPGKTLDSCPSPRAAEWRRDIHEWVEAEVPPNEIRDRLQERVPEFDLSPKPLAFGWTIPLAAVVISTLWFVVMSRRRRRPASPAQPFDADPSFDARLDEELAQLD